MPAAEVLIAGGGPLGMALALALQDSGVACSIVDARAPDAAAADRRTLALSHGSRLILERLGAWQSLAATPINVIHVSQSGGLGRTVLRAADFGLPALGYVVAAKDLAAALAARIATRMIAVRHSTRVDSVSVGAMRAAARVIAGGESETIEARLVVYAEGSIGDGDESVATRDYRQQAIVASVRPASEHTHTAYERFTSGGPLALLPCRDAYALVAARPDAEAARLLALTDEALLDWLHHAFGERMRFDSIGARAAFPLVLRYRRNTVAARRVWLGNAAQTLHPVAGQGFNLALRDAWRLATLLRDAADPGAAHLLQRHQQLRRVDRRATIGFTDALIRIFANDNLLLHHARGAGLMLLDTLAPARNFVARRMMFGARAWL